MDHLSLRPVYPKAVSALNLLCMVVLFFIPSVMQPLQAVVVCSLLLLGAISLSNASYALKPNATGEELTFGIAFFHRFYPQETIRPEQLSSLCTRQLPDKYWALQLITANGAPLLLDKRATLDALQKRQQQLEEGLQTLLAKSR